MIDVKDPSRRGVWLLIGWDGMDEVVESRVCKAIEKWTTTRIERRRRKSRRGRFMARRGKTHEFRNRSGLESGFESMVEKAIEE